MKKSINQFTNKAIKIIVFIFVSLSVISINADNQKKTSSSQPDRIEYLSAPGAEKLNLPFSDAVRVDKMLYLSGKIGNIPGTSDLASGGIQGQTKQALDNIKTSLNRYGLGMDNIIKCTIFMQNMKDWGNMNKVYVTFFPKHKPARSALGANGLALGAVVEIECMASF